MLITRCPSSYGKRVRQWKHLSAQVKLFFFEIFTVYMLSQNSRLLLPLLAKKVPNISQVFTFDFCWDLKWWFYWKITAKFQGKRFLIIYQQFMNLWSRVQRNFFDSQLGQFLVFAPSRAYIGVGIDADEVLQGKFFFQQLLLNHKVK